MAFFNQKVSQEERNSKRVTFFFILKTDNYIFVLLTLLCYILSLCHYFPYLTFYNQGFQSYITFISNKKRPR